MAKGLIICGYPGIGKTSIAGWNNCIDLDSNNFSHTLDGFPQKTKYWVPRYCQTTIDIARQGYTVLISTHSSVIDYLKNRTIMPIEVAGPLIFCPPHYWKEEWVERLKGRYSINPTIKNELALNRVSNYFKDDIYKMATFGLPIINPAAIDYDLKDYIYMLQKNYLEGEGGNLQMLNFAINASTGDDNYKIGFRNGLRFAKSLIDNIEPDYEMIKPENNPAYDLGRERI